MPIYEYRCTSCGHELEVMQKLSDPAPAKCPQCGLEQPMERMVSRSSFQLKGGGWYSDLYGSTKKGGGSSSPASSSTSTASSPSTSAPAAAPASPAPSSGGGTSGSGSSGGGSKP
jgi:putative FmdB family regulatory protein